MQQFLASSAGVQVPQAGANTHVRELMYGGQCGTSPAPIPYPAVTMSQMPSPMPGTPMPMPPHMFQPHASQHQPQPQVVPQYLSPAAPLQLLQWAQQAQQPGPAPGLHTPASVQQAALHIANAIGRAFGHS
jgi:hypothetical protein